MLLKEVQLRMNDGLSPKSSLKNEHSGFFFGNGQTEQKIFGDFPAYHLVLAFKLIGKFAQFQSDFLLLEAEPDW